MELDEVDLTSLVAVDSAVVTVDAKAGTLVFASSACWTVSTCCVSVVPRLSNSLFAFCRVGLRRVVSEVLDQYLGRVTDVTDRGFDVLLGDREAGVLERLQGVLLVGDPMLTSAQTPFA